MDIQAELKRVGKPYRPKFSAENVSDLGKAGNYGSPV